VRIAILAGVDSIHSWRWVEYFARRGHEMHWISLAGSGEAGLAGVHMYEVGEYIARNYVGARVNAMSSW